MFNTNYAVISVNQTVQNAIAIFKQFTFCPENAGLFVEFISMVSTKQLMAAYTGSRPERVRL